MATKPTDAVEPVGKRIRKARLARKITLETMANETGYSVDALKKIESGKKIPPVGTLLQISKVLQIDSADLLNESDTTIAQRSREYDKRTEDYAYTTLTPGAQQKHLKAFKVSIDPRSEHKGVGYQHEGEEFVYVLSGDIEVTVGENVNYLETGDSLHFNAAIRHNLRNTGLSEAELLVVIYTP